MFKEIIIKRFIVNVKNEIEKENLGFKLDISSLKNINKNINPKVFNNIYIPVDVYTDNLSYYFVSKKQYTCLQRIC